MVDNAYEVTPPLWKPQYIMDILMDNYSICTLNILEVKASHTKCVRTVIIVYYITAILNI